MTRSGQGGSDPRSGTEPPPPDAAPVEAPSRSTRERLSGLRLRAEGLQQQAQLRFEQERARRGWIRTGIEAWDMDRHRGGPLLSGGLAYRIFLFELPFLLFLISLFGIVSDLSGEDPEEIARDAGLSAALATLIAKSVAQAGSQRWWLLLLGAWLTIWAARSGVRSVILISTIAWGLPIGAARTTVRATGVFIGVVFAGLASQLLVPRLYGGGFGQDLLAFVVATLLTFGLVLVAMRLLPHGGSPWLPVVPGAILLAVGLRGLALSTDVYFADKLGRVDDLYGGLGIAIVILLYLYLAARLFVWGQFLNARIGGVTLARREEAA